MALMHTPQKDDNFQAPDFTLKNIDGKMLSLNDVSGKNGTVIAFICNHCPYVKAIIERFVSTAKDLQEKGVNVVAIMPNDAENYPEDSFDNMKTFANNHGFTFPYLIDETQDIAKAYDAICTPDIFGFDPSGKAIYRGRLDSSGPNETNADTVPELLNAMTSNNNAPQHSAMGCSIKWKE